ncbi:hypothetical protein DNTS_012033 [Danionella cerebrum]|uniref:Uncharacterized protein n=1 Tax=Danionella cerebrum TaxID=2873325 RepID=A0A553MX82_9TELE|nr:hypothetical protein DNTS_012033 [Danionella translucida]
MDGDSLFGVSSPSEHFSFSDYDVKNDVENNVFPDFNGLNSEQSTSVHQTPLFSDFGLVEDPFPPPDWVFSPPPDFYRDETPDQFQNSSFSETWREDDIFQPFKEKLNSDPLLEFILSRQSKFQSDANIGFQETSSDLGFVNPPEAPDADSRTDEDFRISLSASGIQTADLQTFNPLFQPQKELQADKRTDLLLKAPGIMNESRGGEKPPADGGQKFRRRPVPAPRTKALKNFQQQQLAQAELQLTAVIQNDLEVHEDVLLIGQERCVEDWPEDSPELSPQWKPAGKLRLRRDSVKISGATDGDPGADGDGKKSGKLTLGRKLKGSLLVRRSSKDKIGEELKGSETNANSLHRGSKLAADGLEEEKTEAEHKSKRSTKPKIITQRRLSKGKSVDASVKMLSSQPQDEVISKPADLLSLTENNEDAKLKQPLKQKLSAPRRLSKSVPRDPFQDSDLDLQKRRQSLEFDPPLDGERSFPQTHRRNHDTKLKKKVSVKFVPQRGYVIGLSTLDKQEEKLNLEEVNDPELEGACGFSPDPHLKTLDTPLRDRNYLEELGYLESFDLKNQRLKEDALLDTEPKRRVSLQNSSYSSGFPGSSLWDPEGTAGEKAAPGWSSDAAQDHQDCRPKKAGKFKALRFPRRHSKKPPLLLVPPVSRRDSQGTKEDEFPQKEADLFRAADVKDFDWEEYTPGKDVTEDFLNPPGATSSNYYLSDDSAAEWTWTQTNPDEEQSQETVEGDEDTDSLMEWWNTVENWSEIPSNETISTKEEETVMFKAVADRVHRGLRVYLKLFTERAERLYQHVLILFSIADDINSFHQRSKFANIAGGTTTAVGGAAAIAGLALAPVTFGASIIVSAIGLGVATAGGITAASASISDNIHNMHDRKKIEVIVLDFEAQLVEMHQCLLFISEGLSRLRLHPLLRRNHYYTGDWEVRRALQTISLVSEPLDRAEEIMSKTLTKLASLQKGFDKYFTKDSKEVKKGCKKEVTGEVRSLAKRLHEGLVELNAIREQMLDASGNI